MRLLRAGLIMVMAAFAVGGAARGEGLPAGVPERLAKRLADNPEAVLAAAGDLIAGFGRDGAIDRQGILQAVAMDRAAARARAMVPLIAADLDADGRITSVEMAAVIAASDAGFRGRLMRVKVGADADENGVVERDEMFVWADALARKRVDAGDEARALAYLTLDLDGDGRLTLAEVEEATLRATAGAAMASVADRGA